MLEKEIQKKLSETQGKEMDSKTEKLMKKISKVKAKMYEELGLETTNSDGEQRQN